MAKLPRVIRERIGKLFQRLQAWPVVSGVKPLSGNLAGWYRLRTGDYRLRFHVDGESAIVDKIGQRSEFYEDWTPGDNECPSARESQRQAHGVAGRSGL